MHPQLPNGCLSFPPQGDSITLIKQVNENWVEGKLGDKVGIFPLQLTEVRQHFRNMENIYNKYKKE